jgi:uncharacterized protein (DUF362 family)
MRRRDFIISGLSSGALFFLGSAYAGLKKPYVVVVKGRDPRGLVFKAMEMLNSKSYIKGRRIIIKPNMSFISPPSWGNNTSPEVAKAVCEFCHQAKAKAITVIDNPLAKKTESIRRSGVGPACLSIKGVKIIAATSSRFYKKVRIPKARQLKEAKIVKEALLADLLINVPVAKHHEATGVSIGLKNMMGLVWDRRYFHEMIDIHQGIADLCTVLRPKITIVDLTRCLTTRGPQGPGKVEKLNTIVAGLDPVAVDSVALSLTKWGNQRLNAKQIRYLVLAKAHGLGEYDLKKIKIHR